MGSVAIAGITAPTPTRATITPQGHRAIAAAPLNFTIFLSPAFAHHRINGQKCY
ncbi:MAG: hypothetical protein Fur0042_28600 [Cyanophyceae cyanobacterium]